MPKLQFFLLASQSISRTIDDEKSLYNKNTVVLRTIPFLHQPFLYRPRSALKPRSNTHTHTHTTQQLNGLHDLFEGGHAHGGAREVQGLQFVPLQGASRTLTGAGPRGIEPDREGVGGQGGGDSCETRGSMWPLDGL